MLVARRYLPFLLLIAVQLVLVIIVPSNASSKTGLQTTGISDSATGADGGVAGGDGTVGATGDQGTGAAAGIDPATGQPLAGGATGSATGSTGTRTGTGTGTGTGTAKTGAAGTGAAGGTGTGPGTAVGATSGDITHCVNGRQFGDLKGAPLCTPKFTGDNGGATGAGVTKDTVTVLFYRPKENEVVNSVLRSQGLYASAADESAFVTAAANFINKKYELYGRKLDLKYVQGTCEYSPQDVSCQRTEADSLTKQYKPFGMMWYSGSPEVFDQWSKDGVVNMGGAHFDDSYNVRLRPYHYDINIAGGQQAGFASDYWCKKLAGKNAKYAGDATYKVTKRKLAILVPDDAVKKLSAQTLLDQVKKCDTNSPSVTTYSQDTATATQQATTQVAKFKADGIPSLMCFCDPIAPVFFTTQANTQGWRPEHVMVGNGLIDYDVLGRLYQADQWKHAFGVSDLAESLPFDKSDASVVYRAGGGAGNVPADAGANLPWGYLSLMAGGIMLSGPKLNALSFESALLNGKANSGGWEKDHDPTEYLINFGKGDYTAISDVREVYWDANATSKVDGKAGAYVPLQGGRRYVQGGFEAGEPVLPIS